MPPLKIDPANWMGNTASDVHSKPLRDVAVPGSHDSGAFFLDKNSDIDPSESTTIKMLVKIFGSCARNIIYKWSITQTLTLTQQLEHGVRYLDMRVVFDKKTKDFRTLHGFYGLTDTELFRQINHFLDAHPKEVVILDFNHLLNFTPGLSKEFAAKLIKSFGKKLYGPGKLGADCSLNDIWGQSKQVIALYADEETVKDSPLLWSQDYIYSPWPNTTSVDTLLSDLDKRFDDLKTGAYNVFQAILTPGTSTILGHLTNGSLKNTLALNCDTHVSSWIDKIKTERKKGMNILISDFIGSHNIVAQIILLNYID